MLEKVQIIVSRYLKCDISMIMPETTFTEDLGLDSLDLFEIVMSIEEEFAIDIPSDKLEKMHTVQDITEYLAAACN